MADLISSLPDEIICYILSFLPTQQAVASSVLSKRWKFLWRSVSSFDFYGRDYDFNIKKESNYHFLHSVDSFLYSRNRDQPLHKFRLRFRSKDFVGNIQRWMMAAVSGSCKLQHLDLNLNMHCPIPLLVFCKTLVVLKLTHISLEDNFSVDLPLLKILHLNFVYSSKCLDLSQFFSGTPILEVLEVKNTYAGKIREFRVKIRGYCYLPLEIIENIESLFIDWTPCLDFDLQNLVKLQLGVCCSEDWLVVLELLEHCPQLQNLASDIYEGKFFPSYFRSIEEEDILPFPETVPAACVSSRLKTFCLKNFRFNTNEFEFVLYIMENAKYLQTMKICAHWNATNDQRITLQYLSSIKMSSDTCKVLIE